MTNAAESTSRTLWGSLVKRLAAVIAAVMVLVAAGAYLGISQHEKAILFEGKAAAARLVVGLFGSSVSAAVVFDDRQSISQSIGDLAKNADVLDVEVWESHATPTDPGVLLGSFSRTAILQPMRELRMARELEIASNIQRAMLPPAPKHPDFEFAGKMLPADEVGGDFYDVLVSEQRLLDHRGWTNQVTGLALGSSCSWLKPRLQRNSERSRTLYQAA